MICEPCDNVIDMSLHVRGTVILVDFANDHMLRFFQERQGVEYRAPGFARILPADDDSLCQQRLDVTRDKEERTAGARSNRLD